MTKRITNLLLCLAALTLSACTETDSSVDDAPSLELSEEVAELFENGLDIPAGGGSQELTFYATEPWEFSTASTKSDDNDWCRVTPSSGEPGEVSCLVGLDPNTTSEDRDLSLQLQVGAELMAMYIFQAASDSFFITGDEFKVAAAGETISVIASSNVDYEISIDDKYSWISEVVSKASVVDTEHNFAIAANESGEQRVGYIDFISSESESPERVTITQLQNNVYILSDAVYEIDAEGKTIEVEVSSNISYEVNIPDEYSWIEQLVVKAVVEDKLQFTIEKNEGFAVRDGYIEFIFEGDIHEKVLINQEAGIAYINVEPSSYEASSSSGEEFEISVDSNVEYSVEFPTSCRWLERMDDGSDNTVLKFKTLEANTNEVREVTITLSAENLEEDVELTITQAMGVGLRQLYLFDPYPTEAGYPVLDINPILIENSSNRVNLVTDYGAAADGVTNDSSKLNQAIADVNANPYGGIVYLPKGNYVLNEIILLSNVHLHIEAGSNISLPERDYGGNKVLFSLGSTCATGEYDSNVLISGVTNGYFDINTNGRFEIDLITNGAEDYKLNTTSNASPRNIQCNDVHHFYVGNIDIYDEGTEMAHVTFSANEDEDDNVFGPTNGVIQNISSYGCHYGYGTVQAQAARKIYFNNLYGEGGVVLRFETGLNTMNVSQFGGVFDCKGYDIRGKNGNSTVMISPHSMHNGIVQVSKIVAESMAIGVRMDGGYDATYNDVFCPAGEYAEGTYVADITCTFGKDSQLKSKHFKYMPDEIYSADYWDNENTYVYNYSNGNTRTTPFYYPAPSVCSVLLTATTEGKDPTNPVVWSSVTGKDFDYFGDVEKEDLYYDADNGYIIESN